MSLSCRGWAWLCIFIDCGKQHSFWIPQQAFQFPPLLSGSHAATKRNAISIGLGLKTHIPKQNRFESPKIYNIKPRTRSVYANMGCSFAQCKHSTSTFTCNAHAKRNHIRPTLMSVVIESRFWKHVRVSFAFNFVSKLLNARKVHHRVPLICFCLISCGKLLERIDHAGNRTKRLCMYSNILKKKKVPHSRFLGVCLLTACASNQKSPLCF